jgi:hypothetical protein
MDKTFEEDERAEIVEDLQEVLKSIGISGSPMDAHRNDAVKVRVLRVLAKFETLNDRMKREQPGGRL